MFSLKYFDLARITGEILPMDSLSGEEWKLIFQLEDMGYVKVDTPLESDGTPDWQAIEAKGGVRVTFIKAA